MNSNYYKITIYKKTSRVTKKIIKQRYQMGKIIARN